jgi:hypothetical protein
MPATLSYPGMYIEEIPSDVRTITALATWTMAFIGCGATGCPTTRSFYAPSDRIYRLIA